MVGGSLSSGLADGGELLEVAPGWARNLVTAFVRIDGRTVGISPDYEFHVAIARASNNEFFETIMRQLQTPIEFTINLARSLSLTRTVEHRITIQAEHVGIFNAIEAGDGNTARRLMHAHLDNACLRIFDGPPGGVYP